MSKTTVWRVLRKRSVFKPYCIQINVCNHGEHCETPCINHLLLLDNETKFSHDTTKYHKQCGFSRYIFAHGRNNVVQLCILYHVRQCLHKLTHKNMYSKSPCKMNINEHCAKDYYRIHQRNSVLALCPFVLFFLSLLSGLTLYTSSANM
jgi:hypothetical protein